MIARLLIKPFGGMWELKKKCHSKSPLLRKIAKLVYGLFQYENNSSIAWNSTFKSEPCLPHGIKGVFISGGAKIGSDCVIFQQVTIGSITLLDSNGRGAPVIGDNVYIGAGAKIVGSVAVGNNVRIGANAVVFKDIPDNSVVVVGEQRVINKNEPLDNHFYSFHGKWVYFTNGEYKAVVDKKILSTLMKSEVNTKFIAME